MAITAKRFDKGTVITGLVRVGFAYFFEPQEPKPERLKKDPKAKAKYKCMVIFPKGSDTEREIKALMKDVAKGKWGEKLPSGWHSGLRDGDTDPKLDHESDDEFMKEKCEVLKGMRFFNCSSVFPPEIYRKVDGRKIPLQKGDLKSGDYVQMSIRCFDFEEEGNKAIGFGFDTVVAKKKGEAVLGGGGFSATDVGAFDDGDELGDFDNDDGFDDDKPAKGKSRPADEDEF